jgi:hypothetical protein
MKLKTFCTRKEMVSKLKSLPTEWEKMFLSYASDKGYITRLFKEFKKLNSPKFNDQMRKWPNELIRAFVKEEVQMAKKHMKKYSTSLAIKEMQIKTASTFHVTPARMATIKNNNNKYWQGCVHKGTLIHYWGEYKLV